MTMINIDCATCGATNVLPAGAVLATAGVADLDSQFGGQVGWICSGCLQMVWASVSWQAFLDLLLAGVPLIEEDAETDLPPHPEHPMSCRALSRDDLLDLHELLATDDWFSALAPAVA
jgi:hypothetical protein